MIEGPFTIDRDGWEEMVEAIREDLERAEEKVHRNGWDEWSRFVLKELERLSERCDVLEKRIERMTWALVSAAVAFGSAALMLGVNLWLR